MSAGRHLTQWEKDQAKKLYQTGLSWREVGRLIGRPFKTLQNKLGKECSRSYSETAKMRWKKRPPGPRNLSANGQRQYRKLRDLGYSREEALRGAE